jgi:general secretion pathway protein D
MKKYLALRMRLSALLVAGALGTFALATPKLVEAQSATDKIRLMADTLRARDSGNLDLAKDKAEELIKIAPDDENVQRLLASINRELDRRGAASAPAVYGQAPDISTETAMKVPGQVTGAAAIVAAAAADQETKLEAAQNAIVEAGQLSELGAYTDANSLLTAAAASLTLNTATADTLAAIDEAKAQVMLDEAQALADAGKLKSAEALVEDYQAAGGDSSDARRLAKDIDQQISDPYSLDINEISPNYVAQSKVIRDLLTRGRAQYLNGDYDGAAASFMEVEARDPNNSEAKLYQTKIAEQLTAIHRQDLSKTRAQMLMEVDQGWERPKVYDISDQKTVGPIVGDRIQEKLNSISIPQVNFSGMELTRVIETLSELSVEYDPERVGVNIVPLFNPNDNNPRVNISLRNLNMDRILQFVTQQVNFSYDVGGDAVTIQPSDSLGGSATTITEIFPISRPTVIRLTGVGGGSSSSSGPVDPFAAPTSSSSVSSQGAEAEALQNFFQSAGVNFELQGASLAFDGTDLIVTQTRRNLERMRIILRRYNEVKQVEIEAKFLEVSQNDLEEFGFDWTVGGGKYAVYDSSGDPVLDSNGYATYGYDQSFSTSGRNLYDAFSTGSDASAITIDGEVAAYNSAPQITDSIDLAADAASLFTSSGWSINGYDVDVAINALSRKTGSDLMSAPKVTVINQESATITVAQELLYPTSYGDIESQTSSSNSSSSSTTSSSSSVSITAGTPQDFETRNVGVELTVTPTVENDDLITLDLYPRVTEFEGFVEYGGPSIAISGDTTVTVPAGFYQPIFSIREIKTKVTVYDGATIVMGGLTRDEVNTVNDQVPVLGDIPGIGRLFRSEGETRQKRNLLIFVTANLVSPGGSPSRQNFNNVNANSLFQNPTIMVPSGSVSRTIDDSSAK